MGGEVSRFMMGGDYRLAEICMSMALMALFAVMLVLQYPPDLVLDVLLSVEVTLF